MTIYIGDLSTINFLKRDHGKSVINQDAIEQDVRKKLSEDLELFARFAKFLSHFGIEVNQKILNAEFEKNKKSLSNTMISLGVNKNDIDKVWFYWANETVKIYIEKLDEKEKIEGIILSPKVAQQKTTLQDISNIIGGNTEICYVTVDNNVKSDEKCKSFINDYLLAQTNHRKKFEELKSKEKFEEYLTSVIELREKLIKTNIKDENIFVLSNEEFKKCIDGISIFKVIESKKLNDLNGVLNSISNVQHSL